ncbi:MAG: malto-oligosyltrehalose trehalohydrolase, partial [Anaerolineae bacterium]|nr:malto-oligosyltrehalose trehalohydrolase [Anaerolineae bacterium]
PDGVHGASAVINHDFAWSDTHWHPPTLRNSVFYELHVGTFTPEGTFEAIIPHLPRLKQLGITTLELMPIAQFAGGRNWG